MFPAMGMEVVRRVPAHLCGTAAGGLAMFQDLALGATGPVTGVLADRFDFGVVFLVGGLAASLSFAMVIAIARSGPRRSASMVAPASPAEHPTTPSLKSPVQA